MGLLDQLNAQAQELVPHVTALQTESPLERYFRCQAELNAAKRVVAKLENTVYWSPDGTKNRFFKNIDELGGSGVTPVKNWNCNIENLDRDYPIWRFVRIEQARAEREEGFARSRLIEARKGIDFSNLPDGTVIKFKSLAAGDYADCTGVITHQTPETYVVRVLTSTLQVGATARIKKRNCVQGIQYGGRSLELLALNLEAHEARPKPEWPTLHPKNAEKLRLLKREASDNYQERRSIDSKALDILADRYKEELEAIKAELLASLEVKDYSEVAWVLSKDEARQHAEQMAAWMSA